MVRHPSLDSHYPEGTAPLGAELVRVGDWGEEDELKLATRTVELLAARGKSALRVDSALVSPLESVVRFRQNDFCHGLLGRLGIKVSANSRLLQARDSLERAHRFSVQLGPGDPETEEWLAESKRTIFEISFIVRALSSRAAEINRRLRQMLGGPLVPERGRQDKARDVQSELLVAAALTAGGYKVNFAEPDLVVPDLMGAKTGVAVKRISSKRADQIEKRLRQARDQLARNHLPGIIVINAERHLAHVYQINRSADLSAELYMKVSEWLDYIHERDPSMHVRAVAGVSTSIRLNRATQGFDFRLHFNPRFLIGHESETQNLMDKYAELFTRMESGLRDIARRL